MQRDHLNEEEIAAYVDGALRPAERARVEVHLVQCCTCLAEVIDLLHDIPPGGLQRPN